MSTAKQSSGQGPDALTLLKADHAKVAKLYKEFQRLEKKDDDSGRIGEIVTEVCNDLTVHATIEEEIFYPALRGRIDDDMLDEAKVEHASLKELIGQLSGMSEGDDLYSAKFTVLCEYVTHHVEEEETEMFPKVKRAKVDVAELGADLASRKEELRASMGLPPSPPLRAPRKSTPASKKSGASKAPASKKAK